VNISIKDFSHIIETVYRVCFVLKKSAATGLLKFKVDFNNILGRFLKEQSFTITIFFFLLIFKTINFFAKITHYAGGGAIVNSLLGYVDNPPQINDKEIGRMLILYRICPLMIKNWP